MHGGAVVPHDDVALTPAVHVAEPGRGRRVHQLAEQLLRRRLLHALDRVGVRGNVERAAAVHRVLPRHAPALRRQRRALLCAREVGRDLAARMGIVVPGEGVFELLAQRLLEPLPGETGRDVFGLPAPRGDDPRGEHRGERGHALEGAIGVPELVRLVA